MKNIIYMMCLILVEGCVGKEKHLMKEIDSRNIVENSEIAVCGWFRAQQGECGLSKEFTKDRPLVHSDNQIWVMPKTSVCSPLSVFEKPLNVRAKVSGIYRSGGGFGYMGLYKDIIDNATVELNSKDCLETP